MDNTSKKMFKKSFMGGFKKEDVAGYIADLAAEHSREIENAKNEIKASEGKRIELYNENLQLVDEKKELLGCIDELSVKVSEGEIAQAKLIDLEEKFTSLQKEKESLEAEISALKNENLAKDSKIAQYEAREKELSRSKEEIANLELAARNRAKQIEEEAKTRMANELAAHNEQIKKENDKIENYRNNTYIEMENLVAKMSASYNGTKSAVQDFKTGFKAVVTELAREIDTISDASISIEDAFNALKTDCENMREGK